jgi:hypothetical protein
VPDDLDAMAEVEFVEDLSEKQVAQPDNSLMQKVMAGVEDFYNKKSSIRSSNASTLEESKDSFAES